MTTLAQSLGEIRKPWKWIAIGGGILLIWILVASTSYYRREPDLQAAHSLPTTESYATTPAATLQAGPAAQADALKSEVAKDLRPELPRLLWRERSSAGVRWKWWYSARRRPRRRSP
jgi:hypothetical protein